MKILIAVDLPIDRIKSQIKELSNTFRQMKVMGSSRKSASSMKKGKLWDSTDEILKRSLKHEFCIATPTFEEIAEESQTNSNNDLHMIEEYKKRKGQLYIYQVYGRFNLVLTLCQSVNMRRYIIKTFSQNPNTQIHIIKK